MTSGRDKGIQFERKICVELSKWWTNGKDDSVFWRSNASGARATVRAKKGKHTAGQYGDICAIDPVGEPFLAMSPVECKRGYPKVSVHDILDLPKKRKLPEFEQWIQQARDAAEASPTAVGWLLITSRYSKETMVWFPESLRYRLAYQGAELSCITPSVVLQQRKKPIYGMQLNRFLDLVRPKHYIDLHKRST